MRSRRAPSLAHRLTLGLVLAAAAVGITSCGSDSTGPKPSIAIAVTPNNATIQQGQADTVGATLTYTGNVTGPITISAPGLPAGVTATVFDTSTTGNSTTGKVAIAVAASATPGTYPITVHAAAPGVTDATAPFTLTITPAPAPSFALAVTGSPVSVQQGTNGTVTVNITRAGGFTGAVALTLEGAPTGVTGAFTPASVPSNAASSSLAITVGASVTAQTYNLTVRGKATGLTDQTAAVSLVVTTAPNPSYTLAVTGSPVTVQQGANGTVTVNITRAGGFTGAVALTLEGAPTGVTGTYTPASIPSNATSSSLALAVAASVATQTYTLTVRGKATGLTDRTATVSLVVTAPPAFTLAVTGSPVTVQQGGNGSAGLTITRSGGFTGAVNLAVSGAPTGLTATLNPASIPSGSTTSQLSLAASASLAAQSYTLTVTGSGTGVANKTASVTVNVTPSSGSGNVTLDFSNCTTGSVLWVAYQDGSGAWTQATGTNGIYKVTINSATGGFAYVLKDAIGSGTTTNVQYMTKAQLTGLATAPFCMDIGGKTVTGTIAGTSAGQLVNVSLSRASTLTSLGLPGFPAFTLKGVQSGSHDLLAYRAGIPASTLDRVIIQRGLNPPDNGSVGTLDFGSASAFAPDSASVTVSGASAGQDIFASLSYLTGATCDAHALYVGTPGAAATLPMFGIPAAKQVTGDFHSVMATAGSATAGRTAMVVFHTFGNQTVTLGAALATPTVTSLTAPYKRLQAAFTLGADYNSGAFFTYEASASATAEVIIGATAGYVGGTSATLAMPDFSAVSGWSNAWAPASGASTDWTVNASGGTTSSGLCSEGARFLGAFVAGTN